MSDPDYNYIRVKADTAIDPLVRRLKDPPFGTETSERNLMAQAANEVEKLRTENVRLRDALIQISKNSDCNWSRNVARAALENREPSHE